MTTPLASVLTTVYNREKFLAECIESVLASTFTDFEYIIVDDASTDRSHEIALDYAKRDARMRVYRNEKNLGDYPNRNLAAGYARGKYLKYVDSDDVIYSHGLAVMAASMERFPEAGCGFTRPASARTPFPVCVTPEESYREHIFGGGLFDEGPTASILSRSAFGEVGGFSGRRYVGDQELWLKLAAKFSVVKIAQDLVWWRQHAGQEWGIGYQTGLQFSMSYRVTGAALQNPDCPLNPADRRRAELVLKRLQLRNVVRFAVKRRALKLAWRMFKDSGLKLSDWRHGIARP